MQVVILDTTAEIGSFGANLILKGVANGSLSVLDVATGSSPLPVYAALAERWTPAVGLTAFALDGYVGLPTC